MELKEVIKNRRSIRKYKEEGVSKEILEELVECARLAPSAKNRQPWKFLIVKEEIKNQIANMMIEREDNVKFNKEKGSSVKQTAKIMKQAPILILVLKQYDENWRTGDLLSIGGAIEHICLRAEDLGVGSLWIRDIVYTQQEIAKLVGYADMEVVSAISIGYANEAPKERPRKKLTEILEWQS
ncbi:MAG: nitroreductase [Clostridia bacterium]|jgi:nitroreductase|nr:nitroreductase [Clostridia bacterium]